MFYHSFLIVIVSNIIFIHCQWIEITQIKPKLKNIDEISSIIENSDFIDTVLKQDQTIINTNSKQNYYNKNNINNASKLIISQSPIVILKTINKNDDMESKNILTISTTEKQIKEEENEEQKEEIEKIVENVEDDSMINVKTESKMTSKTKNSKNVLNEKLSYLAELRDDILNTIKVNLHKLWPKRKKRDFMQGENHMDFPSAEGALMTISFLTFAVFLIKLVLQVINTIKSKHYSFNGFDAMPMGTVNVVKKNRYSREVLQTEDNLTEMTKILNAVENIKN